MVALQGASLSPRVPLQVDQSGLGLPSRDYYLNKTENEKVSLPSLPCCARPGQLSFCGGLSFLRVDRQPLVGEGCPHPPASQSGMAGTRASFIPSLKKTVVTAATICRPQAFCGHHCCQADGPFTSPLTRGHSGTAHGHSRGEVSLYTQASSSRTFCAWNALRDTWSEAHTPCPSIVPPAPVQCPVLGRRSPGTSRSSRAKLRLADHPARGPTSCREAAEEM